MMVSIKIKSKEHEIYQLPFEGKDADGNQYSVNNHYLCRNQVPILPIMGEFHFTRWQPAGWREALLKMKAGGIQIVATYIFWIHHEEKQGEWNFNGCRDLNQFLQICKEVGIHVWLRIGPWAHGECRNGGFPDWIANSTEFVPRTNDALYLEYVDKFYMQIGKHTRGMMSREGGPVLGIQLENEFGHCMGGPTTKDEGMNHLKILKDMAIKYGMVVPYYTATGWGGAFVLDGETLPVLGGYVDAPWAEHCCEMPANENFLFSQYKNDKNIGSDLKENMESEYTYNIYANPYLTAELGGGLQVTSHRRTVPFPNDIEAQTLCMLGSGANLIGYYMYHGGINPDGTYSTLQESIATGYNNDLPVKSYDFQTCIKESGELNESYGRLKKLHMFIQEFEGDLAPALPYFPEVAPLTPEDMETPRISLRHNHETGTGFIFINNHQRLRKMKKIEHITIEVSNQTETILRLDNINVNSGDCVILPYHLRLGEGILLRTNATPLCKAGDIYFFYTDDAPFFEWKDTAPKIVVLSKEQANHAYQFNNKVYISNGMLYEEKNSIVLLSTKKMEEVICFDDFGKEMCEVITFPQKKLNCSFEQKEHTADYILYDISIKEYHHSQLHELYLEIDYAGDRVEVYQDNHLIDDWFTTGEPWHMALKRFGYPRNLQIKIFPQKENVYYDLPIKQGCELYDIKVIVEYKQELKK